jgi:tripartite-type tricarboxylate transporter receptor subunit TctC
MTLEDFIAYAKDKPVRISNSGPGAIWHLSAAAFASLTETKVQHIPYKGGNPAAVAVAGGHVDATTVSVPEVAPLVDAGKLRILAVFSDQRHPDFHDVPTLQEKGYDLVLGVWRGLVAPKGTPQEIIDLIDLTVQEIVKTDDFQKFMANNGYGIVLKNSKEFAATMKAEDKILKKLIFDLGLNVN